MISRLLDWLSEFLAHRKGLLPLIGILLVILNFILTGSNLFLHLGIIIAIFGLMLASAL